MGIRDAKCAILGGSRENHGGVIDGALGRPFVVGLMAKQSALILVQKS